MTNTVDAGLQEKLRELELIFADRLPGKIREIRETMANCFAAEPGAESLHTLYRLLHSLAGSAGIFGFQELGQRARTLEIEFKSLIALPESGENNLARLAEAVEALMCWAERSPKGEPEPEVQVVVEQYQMPAARLVFVAIQDAALGAEVASQLENFGFDVLLLRSLSQLDAALDSQTPNAIVLDLGFEQGNFIGAPEIAAMRSSVGQSVPTIFVSRQNSFDVRLTAVRFGDSSYFTKPVDLLELTDRLDAMTGQEEQMPCRVLIVDDDPDSAMYHGLILRDAGMTIRLLHHPAEILQTLVESRPELILMDMYMPDCSGVELARIVRQDNRFLDVPIVFLSAENDFGRQMHAIRSGADEFLTKPISPEHLLMAVGSRIERYRALRALVERDALTGLYNHASSKDQLARELARVKRSNGMLSIAMIDLDQFKNLNLQYGHPVGDQILRSLARLLQQRLRRGDVSGRYSGDEFILVFPETSGSVARMVLDRIRESFSKVRHHAGSLSFTSSFSAGVAEFSVPQNGDDLIAEAENLLLQAKVAGGNSVLARDQASRVEQ